MAPNLLVDNYLTYERPYLMKTYIFGYGSLMESASRLRTTPQAKVIHPVVVSGFQRGWFARTGVSGLSTTFLGCIVAPDNHINGVVYEASEEELKATDKRELDYERKAIPTNQIRDLSGKIDPDSQVWVYANKFPNNEIPKDALPNKAFPIVQSYVDICVHGCIEIEADFPNAKEYGFAVDFIRSTTHWNAFWVNDRIYPRRPFIYRPTAYQIDSLLQQHLADPGLFDKIYFE